MTSQLASALGAEFGVIGEMYANMVNAIAEGDLIGVVGSAVSGVLDIIGDMFTAQDRLLEQYNDTELRRAEEIGLGVIKQKIDTLEREKQIALDRLMFESEAQQALTRIAQDEEQKRYDNLTDAEKEKVDLERQVAREREAIEEEYNKKIRKQKMKQFEAEKKIAIQRVMIDASRASAEIAKEFWAPWDMPIKDQLIRQTMGFMSEQVSLINSRVPSFRGGVDNFRGGVADVHKDERVFLPRGSSVVPASQVQNQTSTLNIANISLPNVKTPQQFMREMIRVADNMGVNLTART